MIVICYEHNVRTAVLRIKVVFSVFDAPRTVRLFRDVVQKCAGTLVNFINMVLRAETWN